jgi:hypothetical protein
VSSTERTTPEALAARLMTGRERLEPAEAARLLGELRAKWLNEAADLAARQGGFRLPSNLVSFNRPTTPEETP